MLTADERQRAADALATAERCRQPIAPLTTTFDDFDIVDAYEVQLINARRRVGNGQAIGGHKVGLSAKAMQAMLGVNEPDYGHLFNEMFFIDGGSIEAKRLCQPRAEIEVAFVLGAPLCGPDVTVADVMRATDHLLPSIEVVDSRIADWQITIADTVADNASSAAIVLGDQATPVSDVNLALIGALLWKNGEIVETGCSGAVLGNPAVAVAWLANKLAAFDVGLAAGHVILPGSCTRMVAVGAGDEITAEFDHLGSVSISFT